MSEERDRREETERRRPAGGPVGTVLGLTVGPFGAAVGSLVDGDRFAFKFAFGAGGVDAGGPDRDGGGRDGLDEAVTVEVEDPAGRDADARDPSDGGESNS